MEYLAYIQNIDKDLVVGILLAVSLGIHVSSLRMIRHLKLEHQIASTCVQLLCDKCEELSKKVKYKPQVIEEIDIKYCPMLEGYLENIIKCFDVISKNPSGEQLVMYGRKLRGEVLRVKQIYKVNVETIALAKELMDKILKDKDSM